MSSPSAKPVAVQFGAGNIGRGFMGELFWAGGYRTVFVDVDRPLIDALRSRGAYEIHHITNEGDQAVTIAGVSGIDAHDAGAVAEAVAGASLVCTAVGVRALQAVTPAIAEGMARRLLYPGTLPLNVITCENLLGAGRFLRELVRTELEQVAMACYHRTLSQREFDARFGFVEAVVSRMVPIVPDEIRRRDPLWIACEPYARLPVDRTAIRGPVPPIAGLEPVENIVAYQRRKLASHNMSHAVCAYLGYHAGHEFIWQAMDDPQVERVVRGAMEETGRALCLRFNFDPAEEAAYEEDLRQRYRNRALGDQVRRVAADPLRKLGPQDRLIGSARLCLEEGIEPTNVLRGIRAALAYDDPADPTAVTLQDMLGTNGLRGVLRDICGLVETEPLCRRLADQPPGGDP
jgi:mannitol-1-phosphate 5-dehydrogenase